MVCASKTCNNYMTFDCKHCTRTFVILYSLSDMVKWLSGFGAIQDIMPYLSANERELMISNTCGDCFDKLYPPLDNDE